MSYFYVIEHISSGKLYAGSRIAKNSNPDELLTSTGYKTSSTLVKSIIKDEGVDSFRIRYIKEFENNNDALRWETRFLQKIDAARNERFLNGHNNTGAMSHEKRVEAMMNMYGVEYPMQSEVFKNKNKQTCLKKYGVEYFVQSEVFKEKTQSTINSWTEEHKKEIYQKRRDSNLERYGVDNPSKNDEIKARIVSTFKERYGTEYAVQNTLVREAMTITMLERYGVEHALQSEEIKQKFKETCLERFGTEHHFQNEDIKKKKAETYLQKFGVDCITKSEHFKNKSKETYLQKYGVEHHTKVKVKCPHCDHVTSKNVLPRHMKKHASK